MAKPNSPASQKKRSRGRPKKTLEQKAREIFKAYKNMSDEQIRDAAPNLFRRDHHQLAPLSNELIEAIGRSQKQFMQGYEGSGLSLKEIALLNDEGLDDLSPEEVNRVLEPIKKKLADLEQKKAAGSREGAQRRTRASREMWRDIFDKAKQSGIQFGKPYPTAEQIRKKWGEFSTDPCPSLRSIADAISKFN
jgi:ribosomal protein L29